MPLLSVQRREQRDSAEGGVRGEREEGVFARGPVTLLQRGR